MSDNEFDNIPDDFADVHGVDWVQILGSSTSTHRDAMASTHLDYEPAETLPEQPSTMSSNQSEPSDSSLYFSDDDDMDTTFLAELDRLEETLMHTERIAASASTTGSPHANVVQATANAAPSSELKSYFGVLCDVSMAVSLTAGKDSEQTSRPLASQSQSHRISEQQSLHLFTNSTQPTRSSTQNVRNNSKRDGEHLSNLPNKRPRLDRSPHSISPRSKGKLKADDNLQCILSNYEDELTCPICCDLFVASHVGNPCGHNFCGDCGWQWHHNAENKNKGCPCCRKTLNPTTPMIPNISMNNTVEKHVQALGLSGIQEWQPGGQKYEEWTARKNAWRDGAKKREILKKKPQRNRTIVSLGTIHLFDAPETWLHQDNSEEDPTYEDSDVELIPRPIQPVRWRRGRER
ncbi:hypothetical protein BJ912DRAFT_348772 [Pholiota molesta]|nr:hypothetical protein BJ912DRAFT_348772 [Pholiota molesta]